MCLFVAGQKNKTVKKQKGQKYKNRKKRVVAYLLFVNFVGER